MAIAAISCIACASPVKETATETRVIEGGGTGPFKAELVTEPALEAHTIFRPADLTPFGKKNPLPVLVWGNGACTNSPWEHQNFLNEIASNGFIVIATGYMPPEDGSPYRGEMSKPEQQIEALDWAEKVNSDKSSPYFGKLDLDGMAAAGMSCGGLQTLYNCADPRLKTIMICNSGLFLDPTTAIPGMPMPSKEKLAEISVPVIYILGGETDIAYNNGMDDFNRIDNVPAVALNYPVGHGGTYREPYGGEFSIPAVAWLKWQLKGDGEAAGMFVGEDCGMSRRKDWTIDKKNID